MIDPDPAQNLLARSRSSAFTYGMKRDVDGWLASLRESALVRTLTELRAWNLAHRATGTLEYAQARLDGADAIDLETDRPRDETDRARDLELNGARGIDAALAKYEVDALLFPGSGGAAIAARPAYPPVIVPFAMVENDAEDGDAFWPEGCEPKPRPFGVSFTGSGKWGSAADGQAPEATRQRRLPVRRARTSTVRARSGDRSP